VALTVIELRRRETHDPSIGASAERFIVERELRELAADAVTGRGGGTRVRPWRAGLLATAGRWFRKQSR
jgi:hypothetical protein